MLSCTRVFSHTCHSHLGKRKLLSLEKISSVHDVKFQTRAEGPGANISEPKLASGFSQHPLVPTYYRVWLAHPALYSNSPAQGWAALPPDFLLHISQTFWLPTLLIPLTSRLLQLVLFSLFSFPLHHHMAQLSLVVSTVDSPGQPCLRLCSPIYLQ